jgi:hypothetical protein
MHGQLFAIARTDRYRRLSPAPQMTKRIRVTFESAEQAEQLKTLIESSGIDQTNVSLQADTARLDRQRRREARRKNLAWAGLAVGAILGGLLGAALVLWYQFAQSGYTSPDRMLLVSAVVFAAMVGGIVGAGVSGKPSSERPVAPPRVYLFVNVATDDEEKEVRRLLDRSDHVEARTLEPSPSVGNRRRWVLRR